MKITRQKLRQIIKEEIAALAEDTGDTGDTGAGTVSGDGGCQEGLSYIASLLSAATLSGIAQPNGRYLSIAVYRLNRDGKLDPPYEDVGWYIAQDAYHRHSVETIADFRALISWVGSNLMNDEVRDVMSQACDPVTMDKVKALANGIAWYYNHTGEDDDASIHGADVEEILANGHGRDSQHLRGAIPTEGVLRRTLGL
jgi:hypothetical protein